MRLTLQVTMADGSEQTAIAIVPDFISWEKHTKKKISDLAEGAGIGDMAYLAWSSIRRKEPNTPDYETWVEQVDSLEAVDTPDPKSSKKVR